MIQVKTWSLYLLREILRFSLLNVINDLDSLSFLRLGNRINLDSDVTDFMAIKEDKLWNKKYT
jgi:hypothetical protein